MKIKSLFFLFVLFNYRFTTGQTQPAKDEIPKDFKLQMDRTPCYGSCPVYTLSVDASGMVIYSGFTQVYRGKSVESRRFNKKWKISKDQLLELIRAIEEINYFALVDLFDDKDIGCKFEATDMPGANIDITLQGKKAVVKHYHGCFLCQDYYKELFREKQAQATIDEKCRPFEEHDRKVKRLFEFENEIDRILEYNKHVKE